MICRMVLILMLVILLSNSAMTSESQPEFSLSEKLFYEQVTTNPQPTSVVVVINQKSPLLAGTMSLIIPGLGQFYNDQFLKGLIHFSVTISGVALYIAAEEDDLSDFPVFTETRRGGYIRYETIDVNEDNYLKPISFGIAISIHLYSAVDAVLTAKRINKQNLQRAGMSAIPLITPNQSGVVFTYRW